MAIFSRPILMLFLFILSFSLPSISHGRWRNDDENFRVRAVNLGGWLVTEGWIKPSLFDAIPNKDFLVIIIIVFLRRILFGILSWHNVV